jgi:hypothetical protein
MAEILPEPRQQNRFQLAHFKSARSFDEELPVVDWHGYQGIARGSEIVR